MAHDQLTTVVVGTPTPVVLPDHDGCMLEIRNPNNGLNVLVQYPSLSKVELKALQSPLMNGVDATRAIRQSAGLGDKRNIPIIALTACAMTGDREKFLEAGMDDYLAKPVKMEDLAKVLEWGGGKMS